MAEPLLDAEEIAALESRVGQSLATGSTEGLDVLGYGEITLVVGWPTGSPRVAAKRLPPFADDSAAQRYGALVGEYIEALADRGIEPVRSEWVTTPTDDGEIAGYVVQPVLPGECLGMNIVTGGGPSVAAGLPAAVLERVASSVDPRFGLDAQVSNWAMVDGSLRYFDVTTPMLCDAAGRTRLDLGLLTAPLPAALRPVARRWIAPGIVASYHRPRDVAVDLIGNLLKERAGHLIDGAIDEANRWAMPPITRGEIDRWYRSNARLWELMLRLRRAEWWWQRHVRRRNPAFLLPGPISR
ncbi:MAG: hypothetical protein IT195_00405 [Microthrixaceae bacterium]|nr:hypothetical protein [Microthrixaceae bacterium]